MSSIGVTVSSKGYIVLPAKLRKEMDIKAGTRVLLTREKDKLILRPISSFTQQLSGITRGSFGASPKNVEKYLDEERKDR